MMFINDLSKIKSGCCNDSLPPLQVDRVRNELPTMHDEALSYQEAMLTMQNKINQLVNAVNHINLKQIADIKVTEVNGNGR